MTITEYKTIGDMETARLDAKVNAEIANGFQPYGTPYTRGDWHCQAVVKEELESLRLHMRI